MSGHNVEMLGKKIQLEISDNAAKQLSARGVPLFIEMELYFSCFIRKRVLVRESIEEADAVVLANKLIASFHPWYQRPARCLMWKGMILR